jgi:hypothetical protein
MQKTVQVGLFRIIPFKEGYLTEIAKNILDWQLKYETTPVKVNADIYYASCVDFQEREKILDVRLSKQISTEVHKRKRGEEPKPIPVGDDEDLEGITYLRFYFGKQLCFFISNKDVSPHAPARFINWNENLIETSDEAFLEGFGVVPYMKKHLKNELDALDIIQAIDLKFDLKNQSTYKNEIAKNMGLPHMESFNGKFGIDTKKANLDDVKKNVLEFFSKNPDRLIVQGKVQGKSKQINLTEARYKESSKMEGRLTQEKAFIILSEKYRDFSE